MRNVLLFIALTTAGASAQGLPPVVGKDIWHTVKAGEDMHKVSRRYDVALEHLAWANGRPIALAVEPGAKLRVPLRRVLPAKPPADGIVVNLPERGAYLFRGGRFVKFYPLTIGVAEPAKFRTPVGLFTITETLKNPDWHAPKWAKSKVKVVKSGNKKNPLGDRWIGISAPGVGFHSNKDPIGLGEASSHGCMRMAAPDARHLFERVQPGYAVRIDYQPFRLGVDPASGQYFASSFPDVYMKGSLEAKALQVLGQGGLSGLLIDRKALTRAVKNGTGVPVAVAGSPVSFKLNGQKQKGALVANGTLLVDAQLTRKLGMQVAWEQPGKLLKVSRGKTKRSFAVNQKDGAQLYGKKVLVPMRELSDSFKLAYDYNASKGTVVVRREN